MLTNVKKVYIIVTVLYKRIMTVTTNERGQQNLFAREPQMYVDKTYVDRYGYETHNERAEKLNGRAAMLGIVAGFLSYAFTGNFFFGLF